MSEYTNMNLLDFIGLVAVMNSQKTCDRCKSIVDPSVYGVSDYIAGIRSLYTESRSKPFSIHKTKCEGCRGIFRVLTLAYLLGILAKLDIIEDDHSFNYNLIVCEAKRSRDKLRL